MDVGEVRPAQQSDFDRLFRLATEGSTSSDWELVAKKTHCSVFTRSNDVSLLKMIRISTTINDVSAATVYNCLHDAKFRPKWDKNMVESREICVIDAENDVGYYQVRTPAPLKNRDFVTQRSWCQGDGVYMIMNHSVFHKAEPPRKNVIRGISYFTGYVMEATGKNSCRLTYISQSNPGGNIPIWLINKLITVVAPKVTKKMTKAAREYESWKKKNQPDHMPWLWPDQITTDFINWDDIVQHQDNVTASEEVESITPDDVTDDIIREE